MPPITNDGSRPARSSACASRLVVVVLPWVPATTTARRPAAPMKASPSSAAPLVIGWPRSSTTSTSGLPRDKALPITTRSASCGTLSSAYGVRISIPSSRSCVDIGG